MEPDKENRQEDLCAAPRSKRRSSILKEVCETTRFIEEETQLVDQTENTAAIARRKSKRVSFAETKKIKVFQSGISDGTEWNSSYAALVSSSSSDSSGAATTLDAGHDSTHGERTRTSLTDQLQQLPAAADETAHHRLQASQQPFQNEYEVDVEANLDDDKAGSSSDFLSCFMKQQPSQSRPCQFYGESSEQDMNMTCAAASDDIQNSDNNQRELGSYGDLDLTCIPDADMELTCAISVQRSATHINLRSEPSTVEREEMELTSAAAFVHKSMAQSCLTTVGTGVPNSLGSNDELGIADMESTCTASNVAKLLSNVAASQEFEHQTGDHGFKPTMELATLMPSSQTLQSCGPRVENEDTQGLVGMKFTSAFPNLQKSSHCEAEEENEDTRGLVDMEFTCALPNLHSIGAVEGNEDTKGFADMELTCAVSILPKMNPSVISADHEDTRGLADMELTYAVPNGPELMPSVTSAENEDTRGLADMELTCAVPNLRKMKPSEISAENEDSRGLADMELTCAVPNGPKLKPSAISAENEDNMEFADMELTCAVFNPHKLKSSEISAENEDSRGLAEMELTCAVPNLHKMKPNELSVENEDTRGLADMELTCAVPNVPELKPSVISVENEDTCGLTDMELTGAVPNVLKLKPSVISVENEDTCGLTDMELTSAVPNLHKLKPSVISADNEDIRSIAEMEFTCSTSNLGELRSLVSTNFTDETQMVIPDELETTCPTASNANMESKSTLDNELKSALQGSCCNQSLTRVNLAAISGVVPQNITESQPTSDEAGRSSEDAMARISSGTREFCPTEASSSNEDADVPHSLKDKLVEAEKKIDRKASENVACSDDMKTVVRRKSILSTKTKYNGEKTVGEDERTVQFCMEVDVLEINRASAISDVTKDHHTKEKELENSRTSETVNNHPCSRAGNCSASAMAAHAVESGSSDTAPHSSTAVSDLTDTSDDISKATLEPNVSLNDSCVRRCTTADHTSMSLHTTPGQLVSQNRVSLAVSAKRRSSENSLMASEKVFIMSPKNKDETRLVYRINRSGEISDPLSLLVPAASDYSVSPVAADWPNRDHPSAEFVEVKQEMNDTNSSEEFLSNVTVHLVDSDESPMTSPEKAPNASAVGGLVATSERPRPDNRRRSSAAAAAAMSSCRALLQSVQSAITSDTAEHADSTCIDDIVKELNKSLSTFANSEDEESEESVSADVQHVKQEDISVYPNEKNKSVLLYASVRPELVVKTTVDRSKLVRLSTTRTSFVSMDESDEKVDEIWNQEILRDTNCQPTDQAAAAQQTILVEGVGARANVAHDDARVTELIESQKPSENRCVAMLPSYNKSVQLLSNKPCAYSDASRTTPLNANSAVSLSSQSTEDITNTGPVAVSSENSMESIEAVHMKNSSSSCPGQVDVNKSSVQVSIIARGPDVAVRLKPKMPVIDLCQDCSPLDEMIIYKDSRDAVLLHRQGSSATLRLRHRRYSVLLALSSSDAHCTVKEAQWRPSLQELQRPLARLAVSTFSYSLSQSCEALRGLRVCCLYSMLEPLLCSFNAVADLLLELFSLLQRFAVQFTMDRVVLLLSGRQGDLVEVSCLLRAEAAAAEPRYALLPAARSLLGCIRAASVATAMREVDAGPRLLTRTVDAALAVVDSWQH